MVLIYWNLKVLRKGRGVVIPRGGLGDIALSLEFVRELFLVVVEKGDVRDDDDWERESHCVEDGAGAFYLSVSYQEYLRSTRHIYNLPA